MNALWSEIVLFRLILVAVTLAWGTGNALSAALGDPEDSPLFSNSRTHAFAEMTGHNQQSAGDGQVIVVEGNRWHRNSGTALETTKPAGRSGPQPRDITTDLSCTFPTMCTTCAATTCGATCDTTHTCWQSPTCRGNTCTTPSCVGPTCSEPTCWGVSCSMPGPTCFPAPTCTGTITCGTPTCTPAQCPVTLYNVTVPRAGEIQMSFDSTISLRYALQYCTNLSEGQWAQAYSAMGNGGVMTFGHTNDAPQCCYRVLVQLP